MQRLIQAAAVLGVLWLAPVTAGQTVAPEPVPPPKVVPPLPPVPRPPAPYTIYFSGPGVSSYTGPNAIIYQASPVPVPATIYAPNLLPPNLFIGVGGGFPRNFGGYQGPSFRR